MSCCCETVTRPVTAGVLQQLRRDVVPEGDDTLLTVAGCPLLPPAAPSGARRPSCCEDGAVPSAPTRLGAEGARSYTSACCCFTDTVDCFQRRLSPHLDYVDASGAVLMKAAAFLAICDIYGSIKAIVDETSDFSSHV